MDDDDDFGFLDAAMFDNKQQSQQQSGNSQQQSLDAAMFDNKQQSQQQSGGNSQQQIGDTPSPPPTDSSNGGGSSSRIDSTAAPAAPQPGPGTDVSPSRGDSENPMTLHSRPEQEEVVESFNDVIPDPEATAPTVFRVPTRQAQADQQRTQPPPPPAKTVQMPPGAPPLLSQQQAKTVSMPPGAPPLLSQHQKAHPSKFKVAEAPPPQSLLTPSNKRPNILEAWRSPSTFETKTSPKPVYTRPADVKFDSTLASVVSFIIPIEFCEQLAFFGFQGSLVLYFTRELGMTNANADINYAIFVSICLLSCLLGAWLADTVLGRYKTILITAAFYLLGLILTTIFVIRTIDVEVMFWLSLYCIAVSTGGIKANASALGAEQFDGSHGHDSTEAEVYFDIFYWMVNIAGIISFTAISALCQNQAFEYGYAIPTIVMGIGLLIFFLGNHRYIMVPPSRSVISEFFTILYTAQTAAKGEEVVEYYTVKHWLDRAKKRNGGHFPSRQVDDVKYVLRLFPFMWLMVIYWLLYSQLGTTFYNQGCQMNLKMGNSLVPISSLMLVRIVTLLIAIPICDKVCFPSLQRRGFGLTMLMKMAIGMFLALLAMIAAGIVEVMRLRQAARGDFIGLSLCHVGSKEAEVVDMSIWWQVPQYILVGLSEVLTVIPAVEFFYRNSPRSTKSIIAALNLVSQTLGLWVFCILVRIVNAGPVEWIANDLNQGHLDYFFWLLAAIMFANLCVFIYYATRYEEPDLDTADEDVDPNADPAIAIGVKAGGTPFTPAATAQGTSTRQVGSYRKPADATAASVPAPPPAPPAPPLAPSAAPPQAPTPPPLNFNTEASPPRII